MTRKEYKRSLKELKEVAEDLGLTVSFYPRGIMNDVQPGMLGAFIPKLNVVGLSSSLSMKSRVLILAHELGHAEEWHSLPQKMKKKCSELYSNIGYAQDTDQFIPDRVIDFVCDREIAAWDFAEDVLQELEIDVPMKNLRKMRRIGINSYRRILESYGSPT